MFGCESCSKKFRYRDGAYWHMKDKMHFKNQDQNQNEGESRCLDWVFTNNANVHVAKDRSWFVEYTPFETELGDIYREMAQPIRVMGIGTVELFTDPPPYSQERDLPRPLRLTNVLHAPSVVCNVVGWPILEDYNVVSDFGGSVTRGYIAEKEGRHIAYFDPRCNLLQVKLRDSLIGTHSLMRGGPYLINAQWPDTERAKWHAHQNNIGGLLTTEEKMWLKKHYGNEFRFLRNFGLSIYKEEDREYGRTLLRAFMEEEKTRSGA